MLHSSIIRIDLKKKTKYLYLKKNNQEINCVFSVTGI